MQKKSDSVALVCFFLSVLLPFPSDEVGFYFMHHCTTYKKESGVKTDSGNDSPKDPILLLGLVKADIKNQKSRRCGEQQTHQGVDDKLFLVFVTHIAVLYHPAGRASGQI
jgi:hypothetical protein